MDQNKAKHELTPPLQKAFTQKEFNSKSIKNQAVKNSFSQLACKVNQEQPHKKKLKIRKKIIQEHADMKVSQKRQIILAKKIEKGPSPTNLIPGTLYADFVLEVEPQMKADQFLSLQPSVIYSERLPDYNSYPFTSQSSPNTTKYGVKMMGPRFDKEEKLIPRSIVGSIQTYNKKYKEIKKGMLNRLSSEKKRLSVEKSPKKQIFWFQMDNQLKPQKKNDEIIKEKLDKIKDNQKKEEKKLKDYIKSLPQTVKITEAKQEKILQNFRSNMQR